MNGQARTVAESIPWIRKVMRKKNLPVSDAAWAGYTASSE